MVKHGLAIYLVIPEAQVPTYLINMIIKRYKLIVNTERVGCKSREVCTYLGRYYR